MRRARSHLSLLVAIILCTAGLSLGARVEFAGAQPDWSAIDPKIRPSVVLIRGNHILGGGAAGSGFIYNRNGCVLTNHHVVEGLKDITVTLYDGRTLPATVRGYMREQQHTREGLITRWIDMAVVCVGRAQAAGLTWVSLGNSDTIRDGQELLVMGYPGDVTTEKASTARGIVNVRKGWLQTDAQIQEGYSGGPAVDRTGRVVGIAAFGVGRLQKISGFVPINAALQAIEGWSATPPKTRSYFWISGLEYVAPIRQGRRMTERETYREPGSAPRVRELTTEVVSVESRHSTWIYRLRTSTGVEIVNYLDSEGIFQVSWRSNSAKSANQHLHYFFPLPMKNGLRWDSKTAAQDLSGNTTETATETSSVAFVAAAVRWGGRSYDHALRITRDRKGVRRVGGSSKPFEERFTEWYLANQVGRVKLVRETLPTGRTWTWELIAVK
jgi:S1-C subfamily serine protease